MNTKVIDIDEDISESIYDLPDLLSVPPKLLQVIEQFNDYKIFIIEGGRGSAKTQSVARLLLTIMEERRIRVFCGREVQNTIEESVYAVLADLISTYKRAFKVRKNAIMSYISKGAFFFKGFREQGAINIKGVEGADVIWIDEAQAITKPTLDILVPTIRKKNSKLIFTMNRFMRDDAVIEEFLGRPDCLHIKINYLDNPHCPETLKTEAEICRIRRPNDYDHIWLGNPLKNSTDYLFNFDKLYASLTTPIYGDLFYRQRIMSIDFAAQGSDSCVATILDRASAQHWRVTERIEWQEPNTTITVGKIVALIGAFKPTITILDIGGGGHNVHCDLTEAKLQVQRFDGGSNKGVNTSLYLNQRSEGYHLLEDWFENGFLKLREEDKIILKELSKVKVKHKASTVRQIEDKKTYKAVNGFSPDNADSLMMAIFAAVKYLGKPANASENSQIPIHRKNQSARHKGTKR